LSVKSGPQIDDLKEFLMTQVSIPNARRDSYLVQARADGPAFYSLIGEAGRRLDAMGSEARYTRGAMLFVEGESARRIFILRNGRIKLSITSREGKTMILRIAEDGDVLGLSAALTASEHELSAEALEPCRVTAIAAHDFKIFIQDYPEAALEATRCVLNEYQLVLRDLRRLALPETIAGRLAHLLLDWLNRRCQSGHTLPRYNVGLTHEEIAAMTGTSRETVNRVLQQFQRKKFIRIHGASLTVLKRKALEQLAS